MLDPGRLVTTHLPWQDRPAQGWVDEDVLSQSRRRLSQGLGRYLIHSQLST
jgi:hypothetical protein